MSMTLLLACVQRRTLGNRPELCFPEWLEGLLYIEYRIAPAMYYTDDCVTDYNRQHNSELTRCLVRQQFFPKDQRSH